MVCVSYGERGQPGVEGAINASHLMSEVIDLPGRASPDMLLSRWRQHKMYIDSLRFQKKKTIVDFPLVMMMLEKLNWPLHISAEPTRHR